MNKTDEHDPNWPIRRHLLPAYGLSVAIAILMTAVSILGILWRTSVYPNEDLVRSFLPNDVVGLAIGVPMVIASIWLAARQQLVGLLLWPGALFFVLYNYFIYLLAMPFNIAYLLHATLVTLSLFAIIFLLASINPDAVRDRLAGFVAERPAAAVLGILGTLFLLRALGTMVQAIVAGLTIPDTDLALLTTDYMTSPVWVIGAILLWMRTKLGYVIGLGLLFQASMLFVGLVAVLVLQPYMTGSPLPTLDILIVLAMGMISFVPLVLFARGAVSSRVSPSS